MLLAAISQLVALVAYNELSEPYLFPDLEFPSFFFTRISILPYSRSSVDLRPCSAAVGVGTSVDRGRDDFCGLVGKMQQRRSLRLLEGLGGLGYSVVDGFRERT